MSSEFEPSTETEHSGQVDQNDWLVQEKYQQYLVNPASVDETWRALFSTGAGRRSTAVGAPATNGATPTAVASSPASLLTAPPAVPLGAPATVIHAPAPVVPAAASVPTAEGDELTVFRGAPGKLAENMIISLGVPTATSVHPLPAAALEANRKVINDHLAPMTGRKVSFTHIIAYAITRGLEEVTALNSSYVADSGNGTAGVVRHAHVGLGLAIDLQRRDGGRSLVVPAVHNAERLDFLGLVEAYEDIVRRARDGKLTMDDYSGVTVTITNPGTLGTTQSVPRLMAGQGAIIGVGAIDYPVEFAAADPATLRSLGIGKVLTLTSTYDHRIIQGAESGLFLKYVHELLVGEHGFYEEVFSSVGLHEPPVRLGRAAPAVAEATTVVDARIVGLIDAYRTHGHLAATLDPLGLQRPLAPVELDPVTHGFSVFDLDRRFATGGTFGAAPMTLSALLAKLRATYCDTVGVEYHHVQSTPEHAFLEGQLERPVVEPTSEQRRRYLEMLGRAEAFEKFLGVRYVGQRRFSLEGGESTIVFLDSTLQSAVDAGVDEAVVGMAHRGRLNVMANVIGKPLESIIGEFEHTLDPLGVEGGDVKYHKGGTGTWTSPAGKSVTVTLAANPSHLETVSPVVEGIARALQDELGDGGETHVLPILIHGDAAMAGQGVVAETFNLSLVPAYRTGGTVHLVINNQVGFTTDPADGRSTRYATDVAKSVEAPIFHVNGDDPEAVARVGALAMAYRTEFAKDVVVDLVCYRFLGHNEGDDPTYTQPVMYAAIHAHESVRALYERHVVAVGALLASDVDASLATANERLQKALTATRATEAYHYESIPERAPRSMPQLSGDDPVDRETLDAVEAAVHASPPGFSVHTKLDRQFKFRVDQYAADEVDWALGEALAFGTILREGTSIRLIGQDVERGTFSSRHAVLVDEHTGEKYAPLAAIANGETAGLVPPTPTSFRIWNSVLSEYAGLGFEYGYTIGNPDALVLWEAQFGDFANGAQIILDNYIAASEEKWGQRSGVVLLLPHGYEGQGPEHSSARIERFLQLSSGENLSVVQPTTAAQYFHLLRAQAHAAERRPLIVITPKSLLRERRSRSPIDHFVQGRFRTVLEDAPGGPAADVRRVVLCSGRLFRDLLDRRDAIERAGGPPVAVLRVEQLSPWPTAEITAALAHYPAADEVIWAQDEPENMGPLAFAVPRLVASAGTAARLSHVSRPTAGSPATGSMDVHELERESLLERAIGSLPA